jgi:hypothetical protein
MCYAVTKGQEIANKLGYARLSSVLVDLALRQLDKIPGYPGRSCIPADAAPPPPPPNVKPGEGGGSAKPPAAAGAAGGAGGTGAGADGGGGTAAAGGAGGRAGAGGTYVGPNGEILNADGTPVAGTLVSSSRYPDGWNVIMILLQGAALCGIGVLLAKRKKAAT